MNKKDVVSKLISVLEHALQRPLMYCSDVSTLSSLLKGIQIGMDICLGDTSEFKIRGQIITERGWTWSSLLPWDEMRQSGMDEMQIIHEMLTIEIIVWQRVAHKIEKEAIE